MAEHSIPRMFDLADEEVVAYRGVSALALAGLIAGLLSPLAYLGSVLLLLPIAAAAASAVALWQIAAHESSLVGRKAALAGLLLGVTFLVAAPTSAAVYRYFICKEASQFASQWIEDVRRGDVLAAHELTVDPRRRAPPEASLAPFYSQSDYHKKILDGFKNEPVNRTLFALGASAQYRLYEAAYEGGMEAGDYARATYAVTCTDGGGERKTFFIALNMNRKIDATSGRCDWTIGRIEVPVRPSGW